MMEFSEMISKKATGPTSGLPGTSILVISRMILEKAMARCGGSMAPFTKETGNLEFKMERVSS